MDKHAATTGKNADLMGDDIVGIILSDEVLSSSSKTRPTGDKLRRFIHHQESIQCLRPLGSGIHGAVLLAAIKNVQYALKVFKHWKQPGPVFDPYEKAIYTSPLANESRGFARLHSGKKDGTWAVRCHGWMKLSDAQFGAIEAVVDAEDLSRWVIVKDYLPTLTDASHTDQILKNLAIPKSLRILPRDMRPQNYRASKIVDLSCTFTAPCPEWSEFEFNFFYTETVYGVLDWFEDPPKMSSLTSQTFLSRTLAFLLRPFCALGDLKPYYRGNSKSVDNK